MVTIVKIPQGFRNPCMHGLGSRGGSYIRWVNPSPMVGIRHIIQGLGLCARCRWHSLAPPRTGWLPLLMGGGNSGCPVWVPPGCAAPPRVMWTFEAHQCMLASLARPCCNGCPTRAGLTALPALAPVGYATIFVQCNVLSFLVCFQNLKMNHI